MSTLQIYNADIFFTFPEGVMIKGWRESRNASRETPYGNKKYIKVFYITLSYTDGPRLRMV